MQDVHICLIVMLLSILQKSWGYDKDVLLDLCKYRDILYVRHADHPLCKFVVCSKGLPYEMNCPKGLRIKGNYFWGENFPCSEVDIRRECEAAKGNKYSFSHQDAKAVAVNYQEQPQLTQIAAPQRGSSHQIQPHQVVQPKEIIVRVYSNLPQDNMNGMLKTTNEFQDRNSGVRKSNISPSASGFNSLQNGGTRNQNIQRSDETFGSTESTDRKVRKGAGFQQEKPFALPHPSKKAGSDVVKMYNRKWRIAEKRKAEIQKRKSVVKEDKVTPSGIVGYQQVEKIPLEQAVPTPVSYTYVK